jgi:CDP-paratose 2-epimerase
MHQRILVTGGAGFVGSAVALAIRRKHPESSVIAVDNLHRRGSELNLPRLREAGVRFVHGDVRDLDDLLSLPQQPELIIECSAEPSVLAGYGGSPEYLVRSNLFGCFNCLEFARRCSSDFIFVSTSRVYPIALLNQLRYTEQESRFVLAPEQVLPGVSAAGISEDFPLDGARSLYGMTKLGAELMVEEYSDAYGINSIIDRCGLITGPWQMGKSDQGVVVLWLAAHYFSRPLSYIGYGGRGKQVRDFLHVDDFCDLVMRQMEQFSLYQGKRFNVGGGVSGSISLRELTALCAEVTGRTVQIGSEPATRKADVPIYITDCGRVSAVEGWTPKRDARSTLRDILDWIQAHERELRPLLVPENG